MDTEKPFLTIDEQIDLLKSRGLEITNIAEAKYALEHLNYYRLSGYSLTLRKNDVFYAGVNFSDLLQIYYFDNDLKSLLLDILAEIEINIKTHIGYILGMKIGPLGYMSPGHYADQDKYRQFKEVFDKALSDNKHEVFVRHHIDNHNGEYPIWAAVETLSFGSISKLFTSIKPDYKKIISKEYYHNIRFNYAEVWFHALSVLRNICAHRARLFNRGIPIALPFPKEELKLLEKYGYSRNEIGKELFFALVIIDRLLSNPSTRNRLKNSFRALMIKYPFVDIRHYGFNNNWEKILLEINTKYNHA